MTDTTAAGPPKREKGKGAGRPAPAVVINGSNYDQYFPQPKPKIGAPTTYTEEMAGRIREWTTLAVLGLSLVGMAVLFNVEFGIIDRWLARWAVARGLGVSSFQLQLPCATSKFRRSLVWPTRASTGRR